MTPKKRIAIFASVSTPQQASVEKDSLPSQIRDGMAWAAGIEGDVVATYQVPGHSRKFIFYQEAEAEMDAYQQLRQDTDAKRFDVLWCRSRDRLGRTAALISQVEAIVQVAGAEVYSAAMPHALGRATETSAIFMSAIESASAQAENIERARRQRSGMIARTRRGLPQRWPYGYRAIRNSDGKAIGGEFEPAEIGAIQMMGEMFAAGHSYYEICQALDASPYRPYSAPRWPKSTVVSVVRNPFYAGYTRWGNHVTITEPSPLYPAAWSPETWHAIQRQLARRRSGGKTPASRFTSIVVCNRCERIMASIKQRNKRAFICSTHLEKRFTGVACHNNGILESAIAEAVQATLHALTDPDVLRAALEAGKPERVTLEERLRQAQASVEAIQAKRDRIARLVTDEKMLPDAYRAMDDVLVEDLVKAQGELGKAAAAIAATPSYEERHNNVQALVNASSVPGWLCDAEAMQVRQALLNAGMTVRVEGGEIVAVALV